jgi:hypothetical protein
MKTNKLRKFFLVKNLFLILFLLALGQSCKKYPGGVPNLPQDHKFTAKEEAKAYVNERLLAYTKVIAKLVKSEAFRKYK